MPADPEALTAQVRGLESELARERVRVGREKAVERLRAEVFSMRDTDGLLDVVLLMFQESRDLGVSTSATGFFFVSEEAQRIVWYSAMENPRKFGLTWTAPELREVSEEVAVFELELPLDESWNEDLQRWRAGEVWSETRTKEENEAAMREFHERCGMSDPLPFATADYEMTALPFEHGWVAVRHKELTEDHVALLADMTSALSLGYLRYLDFHRLESQNLALEQALVDLRETQQQLITQEKMAGLGKLVAGIAHEMNSPIGAIESALDVSVRCVQRVVEGTDGDGDDRLQRAIDGLSTSNRTALEGAKRISKIVQSLKAFARLDEAEYQHTDLHEGIDSTLVLLQTQITGGVRVTKDYGEIPNIHTAPAQLNQVFMHLLRNAADAIGDEGEIQISTALDGDSVRVEIADTGPGIAPEELEHIFDFDFRSNDKRVKLGLGLATDYSTVRDLGGDLQIDSQVGEGTRIWMVLPIGDPSSPT